MIINQNPCALCYFFVMNLPNQIRTIDEFKESILTEKKSTFIAHVYSVDSKDEVSEYLSETKKKYYDASHHCFAYKLPDGSTRYSDAGEPSGTAGARILNAIEHFELMKQLVIVIRFFGGIKLGVGPLGKAYYYAAHQVLNESKIITKRLYQKVIISSDFDQINITQQILSKHKSIILKTEYNDNAKLTCLVKSIEIDVISKKLIELSKNKIFFRALQEFVYK
ncbi:MAG: YigZ family protein [Ignavibacteriaceae bacterium]